MRVSMESGWQGRLSDASDDVLTRVADAVAEDARRYAPAETFALRDGIEAEPAVDGVARVSVTRDVEGDDPLVPIYQEYGTVKMDAQPYMRPALFQKRAL